ncbi:MAG: metallophosphoesterase [Treponema sp.]|jgi:Icc-related predicted phosphoesterase|nr:metallophosphoesterase [Treponema sp.]
MKILCVSDQIDPIVYSSSIKARYQDVDMVLCAGDLPLDYLDFIVSSINRPLLFVYGNHNLEGYETYEKYPRNSGLTHMGSRVRRECGLTIAGLGGSMWYNGGKNQYSELMMFFEMIKIVPSLVINRIFRGRRLDILLTHAAPRGIHDKNDPCHRGFRCFLLFMKLFKPRYLVHGHIHLYDLSSVRTTKYEKTLVINAYSQYVLNTEEQYNHE